MKPLLGLKIDVDTFRGTKEGVLPLAQLLKKYQAQGTFLFSLGPDHTGRAIKRIFRKGFREKVSRTSVIKHYGLKTLLYGTILPSPDIGSNCCEIMQSILQNGFEVGIHTFDHIKWQDYVFEKDFNWTKKEMSLAFEKFEKVFGQRPKTHGAAGWQMNSHAFILEKEFDFSYASDCRGEFPFFPVINGKVVSCPQIPTTLPTLDELIGVGDISEENVFQKVLEISKEKLTKGQSPQIYTLHAEMEGMRLLSVFEKILKGFIGQGYEIVSLEQIAKGLQLKNLSQHEIIYGSIEGRSGQLAMQGPAIDYLVQD